MEVILVQWAFTKSQVCPCIKNKNFQKINLDVSIELSCVKNEINIDTNVDLRLKFFGIPMNEINELIINFEDGPIQRLNQTDSNIISCYFFYLKSI